MSGGPESFVIVTGLSGSGKSYVERCFEDIGFFCIDNLPLSLLGSLLDELLAGEAPKQKVCVVLDIRNPGFASQFPEAYRRIRERVPGAKLIFLDASEESLIRRFSETRRPHPIAEGTSLLEALRREREMLSDLRSLADLLIDTSSLTVHELRGVISRTFGSGESGLVVSLTSFGFKHGSPYDVDLLFDVRFLREPAFRPRAAGEDRRRRGRRGLYREGSRNGPVSRTSARLRRLSAAAL